MKIVINDHRKIFAIQEEFHELFSNLKIEFFVKPHKTGAASAKKIMKHASKTLGECRVVHTKGSLSIRPGMTVTDLKENFRDVYGLSVQIFRKSGKIWIETASTDWWTLAKQNEQENDRVMHEKLMADNMEAE